MNGDALFGLPWFICVAGQPLFNLLPAVVS